MAHARAKILFSEIVGNKIFASQFLTSRVEVGFKTFSILKGAETDAPIHWENQYRHWLKKRHLIPSFRCRFEEDENGSSFLKEIVVGGSRLS
jgi:hypothetical protein